MPQIWAGRATELADSEVVANRRLAGVYERGRAFLGEFGIGKSVLVNRIAQSAEEQGHWVPARVRLARGDDSLALLALSVRELAAERDLDARIGHRARGLLDRIEELTVPVVGGGVRLRRRPRATSQHRAVSDLLIAVASLAGEETTAELPNGRLLLLRLDEIQNSATSEELSQLLTALGDALEATTTERDAAGIRRERLLPIVVYLSGLPDFGRQAAAAGATFSRRLKTVDLEPLSEPELREALTVFTTTGYEILADDGPTVVHMAPEAIDLIVTKCLGDPFLFQLAGEGAWNAGRGAVITGEEAERGWAAARREVTRYAKARLEALSQQQLGYLEALAALPEAERTAAGVAAALGRDSSAQLASTAQALDVDRRLIRRTAGRVRFRSPVVGAYLSGGWP